MSKITELLPREGNFYKLNLHAHTTCSDGKFTPAQLKQLYLEQGYSAVAFSDHRDCIPHPELTDEHFVALTATELDFHTYSETGEFVRGVHLNALASNPATERSYERFPLDYDLINQTVEELHRDGFFVTLNHPVWSNMSTEELTLIRGYDAMEVFNSIAVMFNNYSDDSAFFETFLRGGGRALPIAADDCHKIAEDGRPFTEYYQGFTVIKAPTLSYESILDALRKGNFYSSTGPAIENLWLDGSILHVECSPVCGVFVHSKYLSCKAQVVDFTDSITHAEIDLSDMLARSPYFWVQLRDTNGKKAWAVPHWADQK